MENLITNVGVIGLGEQGWDNLLPSIAVLKNANIQAVCDLDSEKCMTAARNYGAKQYSNYMEMLDNEKLDAVVVASHPSVHKAVLVLVLSTVSSVRQRAVSFGKHLLVSVRKMRPKNAARAFGVAVLLTATYTLILLCTARSIGIGLSLFQIFIVFSIGMLTSTVTPTPGGLIGAEAGLFAGFVAYGVSAADAGAAVLLYRLVSYWLPLTPGAVALALARSRKLV